MGMQLIETIEVGAGGAASIEFTGIPQDGVDLVIAVSGRVSFGNIVAACRVQLNSSSSGYSGRELYGNGSSASSGTGTTSYIAPTFSVTDSLATASTFGSFQLYISNYTSGVAKSASADAVTEHNATFSYQNISAWNWTGTAAISSIQLSSNANFVQYSTASLYMITAD